MTNYYTNVAAVGNNILYRGIKDGRRVKLKLAYTPTLFLQSNKNTKYKSLIGEALEPMKFESMREARDFIKKYNEKHGKLRELSFSGAKGLPGDRDTRVKLYDRIVKKFASSVGARARKIDGGSSMIFVLEW